MRKYHTRTLLYLHETIAVGTGSTDRFTEVFVDAYQPMSHWPGVLDRANSFAAEHPGLLARYLTHTFSTDDVQGPFELASRPVPGRVKIAITESGAS
jgi:hypothetical protein